MHSTSAQPDIEIKCLETHLATNNTITQEYAPATNLKPENPQIWAMAFPCEFMPNANYDGYPVAYLIDGETPRHIVHFVLMFPQVHLSSHKQTWQHLDYA